MKKSSKPIIVLVAALLILVTIIVLIFQGLHFKYEELQRELAQLENQVKSEKTKMVNLKANYQMLSAEDIIKRYAESELGLVETGSDSEMQITLASEEIDRITKTMRDSDE